MVVMGSRVCAILDDALCGWQSARESDVTVAVQIFRMANHDLIHFYCNLALFPILYIQWLLHCYCQPPTSAAALLPCLHSPSCTDAQQVNHRLLISDALADATMSA